MSTRAITKGNFTFWPYKFKEEFYVLVIQCTPDQDDPTMCKIQTRLVNNDFTKVISVTPEELQNIMSIILWHEGRAQIEEDPRLTKKYTSRFEGLFNDVD